MTLESVKNINIGLIGFTSCGKSTTGHKLAQVLGVRFIDLDQAIEANFMETEGHSLRCRQIYKKHGEKFFRSLENRILRKSLEEKSYVLATGGGTPLCSANQTQLSRISLIFYLRVLPEEIIQRMEGKGFPAYLENQPTLSNLRRIYKEREPQYIKLADHIIDTTKLPIDETLKKILRILQP